MISLSARESVYANVIQFDFLSMSLQQYFPLLVSIHHIPPGKISDSKNEVLQKLNQLFSSFNVQSVLSGELI